MTQPSTAISDAVLAAVCIIGGALLTRPTPVSIPLGGRAIAGIGMGIVGLAALAGVIRFGFDPGFVRYHSWLSAFAGRVGVPLIGLGFVSVVFGVPSGRILALVFVPVLIGAFLLLRYTFPFEAYGKIIGLVAIVLIVAACIKHLPAGPGLVGLAGAILTVVAGLAVGTNGTLAGFQRIDIFHYMLAIANGFYFLSLSGLR